MNKIILFLILIISIQIFAIDFTDTYKDAKEKENEVFGLLPDFQKGILGNGYLPDIDFEYANKVYRDFIVMNPSNPFYYCAYGFTFFYLKRSDSAYYYFDKASNIADINYAEHFRLYQLFKINKIAKAEESELDKFINIKYKLGALSLPDIAEYFNIQAIEEYKANNYEKAEYYFVFANKMDPYNTEIISNLLKFSVKTLRFTTFGLILKMYKNSFNDIFNKFIIIFNTIRFIRYLFWVIFIILTMILFIKNFDMVFYVIENSLNHHLSKFQKKIVSLFIIFLPIILELHIFVWFFYITFLNFFFIRRREKIVLGILLLSIALMPFAFRLENHILGKMNTDDNLSVMIKASYSPWDLELIKKIDKLIAEQPLNNGLFFAEAMLYKKGGYFSKAEEEYNKILLTGTKSPEIYNNLGNIMFFKGFYEKAEEYYKKAIEMNENLAEAYFNLGQVYIRKLQLTESNNYVQKATSLNFELINNFMENTVENYHNTELIDCNIPQKYLWEEFMKKTTLSDSPIIMSVKINLLSFIAIITILFSGIFGSYYKHKHRLRRCYTCGKPLFNRFLHDYNDYRLCEKCFTSLDTTVSDSLRTRKFESYLRMKNKRFFKKAKIASFIIPGAGKIFTDKLLKGIILLVLSLMTILFTFTEKIFIFRNPHIVYNIGINKFIIMGIILFILYVISIGSTKEEL